MKQQERQQPKVGNSMGVKHAQELSLCVATNCLMEPLLTDLGCSCSCNCDCKLCSW